MTAAGIVLTVGCLVGTPVLVIVYKKSTNSIKKFLNGFTTAARRLSRPNIMGVTAFCCD